MAQAERDVCTLCEQVPATTTWGFRVCQPCADFLAALDADLKAEEAADPDLAEKGRQAEAAFEAYHRGEAERATVRTFCFPCQRDEHADCTEVAPTTDGACHCRCAGTVQCPTCESTVVLWAQEDEPALANGECCHWMWADWWDGTFRYDLSTRGEANG